MMRRISCIIALTLAVGLMAAAAAQAKGDKRRKDDDRKAKGHFKELTLKDFPVGARRTILKYAGKNKVQGLRISYDGRRNFYHAGWAGEKGDVDIKVSSGGQALELKRQLQLEDVPEAVQKTIKKLAGDSKVGRITEIILAKVKTYQVEWYGESGRALLVVSRRGDPIEMTKGMSLDDVPPAVKRALLKLSGAERIDRIQEVIKNRRKVYVAEWRVARGQLEVTLSPTGKLLRKELEEFEAEREDDKKSKRRRGKRGRRDDDDDDD